MGRYEDVREFYEAYDEKGRLATGMFRVEGERTRDVLSRRLPPPPARVLDVGGGPGAHAFWLSARGYEVHLVDVVPKHVEQARRPPQGVTPLAGVELGDARHLDRPDASCDVVLLLGPLYHLPERGDRVMALREARRVLRPGGLLFAAVISRFASLLDLLAMGGNDPEFEAMVDRDLETGRHRNPTDRMELFTDAYFHRPAELRGEAEEAGLVETELIGLEGPAGLVRDLDACWDDPTRRQALLDWLRRVEAEPSLIGLSAHILAVARTPSA